MSGGRLRLFFASDLHGSDLCFRKFLGAARAYGPDAVVLGGDLTGKALVPILRESSRYHVYLSGEPTIVEGETALAECERRIAALGQYAARIPPDELDRFLHEDGYRQRMLRDAAARQIRRWVREAEEVLAPLGVECYMMAGNDDLPEIVDILNASDFVTNHDERVVYIRGRLPLVGLGSSNVTPFHSPRELPESEIAERLDRLLEAVADPRRAVLNTHCPPFSTGLDFAPEIDADRQVVSYGGQPRMVPVGSKAVLDAILQHQPLLSVHGHCHDSKHRCRVGATTCVNPGSLYGEGVLGGAIVDVREGASVVCQFISG